jgi:hypothetical protein
VGFFQDSYNLEAITERVPFPFKLRGAYVRRGRWQRATEPIRTLNAR